MKFGREINLCVMSEHQVCHHCRKDFETDYGLDYGVIHFHGEINGYICPQCLIGARIAYDILNKEIHREGIQNNIT